MGPKAQSLPKQAGVAIVHCAQQEMLLSKYDELREAEYDSMSFKETTSSPSSNQNSSADENSRSISKSGSSNTYSAPNYCER